MTASMALSMQLIGFIALSNPPCEGCTALISELHRAQAFNRQWTTHNQ